MTGADTNQPSTIKSYIDSGVAAVQDTVGSLTGNPADKRAADNRKAHAELEHDASHSSAKVGPFNLSSSGAATVDNKDRREGKTDQFVGSGKEFVGNAVGSETLKREGRDQNAEGQGKEAAGQVSDFTKGVADRITGTLGSVTSGLVGNKEAQSDFTEQHDKGKTTQRGVEADLRK